MSKVMSQYTETETNQVVISYTLIDLKKMHHLGASFSMVMGMLFPVQSWKCYVQAWILPLLLYEGKQGLLWQKNIHILYLPNWHSFHVSLDWT